AVVQLRCRKILALDRAVGALVDLGNELLDIRAGVGGQRNLAGDDHFRGARRATPADRQGGAPGRGLAPDRLHVASVAAVEPPVFCMCAAGRRACHVVVRWNSLPSASPLSPPRGGPTSCMPSGRPPAPAPAGKVSTGRPR